MKLVISFDEMGIDNGFTQYDDEKLFILLNDFINTQFPEWDISEAFDVNKSIQWDFDNMECHIDMKVI